MVESINSQEANSPNKGDQTGGARLLELAEHIVKLSAILGVFGYMSLRAHLNYLGISNTSSLGIERYLMETYNLVVTTFFPLVSLLLRIGLVVFLLYLLSPLLRKIFRPLQAPLRKIFGVKARGKRIQDILRESCLRPIVPGLLLLLVLGIYVCLQEMLDQYSKYDSVAVGNLESANLERVDVVLSYYFICLVCISGFFVYSVLSRIQKAQPQTKAYHLGRLLLIMFALALLALSLHLPLLYGRFLHSNNYTWVGINYKVDDRSVPICGLLVLDSQSSVLLWRAEKRAGKIIEIPRSQIQTMSTGPTRNLLELAKLATTKDERQPDCELLTDLQGNPIRP